MRQLFGTGLVLAIVWGATIAFGGAAAPPDSKLCIPVGTLVLKAPAGVKAQRAAVDFPHSRHFGVTCQTCHHTWQGDARLQGCTSAGCHDLTAPVKATAEKPAPPPMAYYKNAFHGQCIGCHKAILKRNADTIASGQTIKGQLPASGPTACIGCHPRH
jgi:hypothetical protein